MLLVKEHTNQLGQTIVAVCDKAILGQKFEEGNRQLDLTTDFYAGKEMPEQDIADLMRNAYIVNMVGEEAIKLGLKEEIISPDHIIEIAGIPHAEAVLTEE